ncbi:MAG: hypothetical protein LQ350_005728 [Teloschistes chrysophthalmus]|nr:MAG: hypothetical protein LQ350_005728 [Niorma chrysophthalma]
MNFKSQAEGGTIFAATSEAAGAGAVALNGFLELLARGPGMDADAFDFNKPLFFSVTMDLKSAQINVHWIEKTPKKNEYTFHLEELTMLPLGDGDSIQVLRRALKNIQDYAIEHLLPLIVDALDEYGNNWTKEREKDMAKQQADAEPPAPPSPPKPPRSKRTRSAAAKATKEATEARLPSQQDKHMPAEAHRPGVRTRRTARLDQSPNEDTARKWTSLSTSWPLRPQRTSSPQFPLNSILLTSPAHTPTSSSSVVPPPSTLLLRFPSPLPRSTSTSPPIRSIRSIRSMPSIPFKILKITTILPISPAHTRINNPKKPEKFRAGLHHTYTANE